jgi:hypothetical protein
MRTKYDTIFIPGGGLTRNGHLPDWTTVLDPVILEARVEKEAKISKV